VLSLEPDAEAVLQYTESLELLQAMSAASATQGRQVRLSPAYATYELDGMRITSESLPLLVTVPATGATTATNAPTAAENSGNPGNTGASGAASSDDGAGGQAGDGSEEEIPVTIIEENDSIFSKIGEFFKKILYWRRGGLN
jgi:hypothetical protein